MKTPIIVTPFLENERDLHTMIFIEDIVLIKEVFYLGEMCCVIEDLHSPPLHVKESLGYLDNLIDQSISQQQK